MADENRIVGLDVDGYQIITKAVMDLLNSYPGLGEGEEIRFSVLDLSSGRAMFPSAGAVITQERISITDHVSQECQYPFSIVYRAAALSEARRTAVKEWLDQLGRWLEMQTVPIGDTEVKLAEYPKLDAGREFRRFSRMSPAYLYTVQGNQSEDWAINISAYYHNEFDR